MSCCAPESQQPHASAGSGRRLTADLICLIVAGFLAGNSLVIALVANLADDATARFAFQTGLLVVTGVVIALLGPQVARRVNANLRRRQLAVDLLFVLGCVGAMAFSMRAYVQGIGAVYFEIVSILLVIYCLGNWIKGRSQQQIWAGLDAWSPAQHRCEVVGPDGHRRTLTVQQVQAGDQVQVPAGGMVPVDGVIVGGTAFVQSAAITGEPHVQPKGPGESVVASSIAVDAPLQVRATAAGDQRSIDWITRSIENAAANPSRWQTQADRIAGYFTPAVALLSLVTLVTTGWYHGADEALMRSLAVLLIACPCAFGFATPVSIWVTLSRLSREQFVVRRNDVIERLAAIDTVVFDKTGTLTVVEPQQLGFYQRPGEDRPAEEILSLVQALQRHSQHPLAVAFNPLESGDVPSGHLPVRNWETIPAIGVRGQVQHGGHWWNVTVRRWQWKDADGWGNDTDWIAKSDQRGSYRIAVEVNGELAGVAEVGETPIDTLERGLVRLQNLGLDVQLFSGDQGSRVRQLPVAAVRSGMTPRDKAEAIQALNAAGRRVLFVGDGINDVAAMTASDACIAPATASDLARETADLVWHGQRLEAIGNAIAICRRSVHRLRTALLFAITYNSVGMLIAAFGWLHPVAAVILMMASSLTVVFYAADGQAEASQTARLPVKPMAPPAEPPRELVQLG